VDFANGILERVGEERSITWLHVLVPRERDGAAYLEPLNDLILGRTRAFTWEPCMPTMRKVSAED
jgi:hypothetical protein